MRCLSAFWCLPRHAQHHRQTRRTVRRMSALPPKADIGTQSRDVRFVPLADISSLAEGLPPQVVTLTALAPACAIWTIIPVADDPRRSYSYDAVNAAAELRCSGLAHWNSQHRSRGYLRPLRIARASCSSSAGYYLLGRTRDTTVPLSRTWVGQQRTRSQEFQTSWPASGQRILATFGTPSSLCAITDLWEQPMPVGYSFLAANRLGEDHDKISMDRSNGDLVGGRSHDSHGSKWSAHWRISTSSVEPEFLWPLRLPSSLLRLLSCLPHRGWLLGLLSH
jgi:hypothetical protein